MGGATEDGWYHGKDVKTRSLPESEERSPFRGDPKYHLSPVHSQLQKWIWMGLVVFSQPCGSVGLGRG